MKILGLDLGTNSIGWAVVEDQQNKILDSGVRIFPEGVLSDTIGKGDKEVSKNSARRIARQTRRLFYRNRLRKIKLLRTLINFNMCPLKNDELDVWSKWDSIKKKEGRKSPENFLPSNHPYHEWLKQNPYTLRDKALSENISLFELGRILYHLIQRRGFLSNRKGKDDGAIYKGKNKIKGIFETQKELEGSTLGRYLSEILPKEGEPFKVIKDELGNELRVRARYTLRDMYIAEFDAIWEKQTKHLNLNNLEYIKEKNILLQGSLNNKRNAKKYDSLIISKGEKNVQVIKVNDILSKYNSEKTLLKVKNKLTLKEYIAGKIEKDEEGNIKFKSNESVLFWQRHLRSQKKLLAKCRYEPTIKDENDKYIQRGKTPCHISHPLFEEYRAYKFINNIEYGKKQKLDESQRYQVLEFINANDKNFEFKEIKKKLKLEYETFNFDDDYIVNGNYTLHKFNLLFPESILLKEFKHNVNNKESIEYGYEKIWHLFHFSEDNDYLIKNLIENYELPVNLAIKVESINLKEGYSNISLKAIKNILPFLKEGFKESDAVLLGGVKNIFGERWFRFNDDFEKIKKDIITISKDKKNKEGEAIKKIQKYLIENNYGFIENDIHFKKLYHHSQDVVEKKMKEKIGEIENLRNPIVQQGINEVSRLVNELLNIYGNFDQIRVELGRDIKNNKKKRQEISKKISDNTKLNDTARQLLTEYGLAHSRENIHKVLLYQELQFKGTVPTCPYTNRTINISDILGKGNKFQIEHIIPKSVSLDDSFANKTLCESKFNALKGEKTPYEFYQTNKDVNLWGGAISWDDVERRAFKLLPYAKAKRFTSKTKFDKNEFVERQLNDTRYISKKTKEILSGICSDVRVMPGALTAELRKLWGLNNILQPIVSLDISDLHIDMNKIIPHYVVLDVNKNPIKAQRIYNTKPEIDEKETTLYGIVDKGIFKSKEQYVKFSIDAPHLTDGEYWAKLELSDPKEIVKVFRDKPALTEEQIVVIGKIDKEKFKNENLNSINAKGLENGSYWAILNIRSKKFEKPDKKEHPKKNGKQIILFGEVQDGIFSSYIYQCETNQQDGKYWLIIDVDFESAIFEKALNEKPKISDNQIVIQGITNNDKLFVSEMDKDHQFIMENETGKYYVLFDIVSKINEFFPVKNEILLDEGQTKVEGNVWVDKYTGEIKFDPLKNRDDHRHHAVDALVIALTKERFFQEISKRNASVENKKRGLEYENAQLDFKEPWDSFYKDAKESINKILVSFRKNEQIVSNIRKRTFKNGKTYTSVGKSVRGQLHLENVYGLRISPNGQKGYHRRKDVSELTTEKQINKIVDDKIKEIINKARKEEIPLYKEIENLTKQLKSPSINLNEELIINNQIIMIKEQIKNLYTLPNKRGERVPIKKVRISEEMSKAQQVKPNINQHVNLKNNHHVLIYKDFEGILQEVVVTFWTVVERKRLGLPIYQLPEDGKEIITTLHINDMFLLGLNEDELNWDKLDNNNIKSHLYKIQTLSKMYYEFRLHSDSSQNKDTNSSEFIRIQNFGNGKTGWKTFNPIKVKMTVTGTITRI